MGLMELFFGGRGGPKLKIRKPKNNELENKQTELQIKQPLYKVVFENIELMCQTIVMWNIWLEIVLRKKQASVPIKEKLITYISRVVTN